MQVVLETVSRARPARQRSRHINCIRLSAREFLAVQPNGTNRLQGTGEITVSYLQAAVSALKVDMGADLMHHLPSLMMQSSQGIRRPGEAMS